MRGIGNHVPPAEMQAEPEDNKSVHVMDQVRTWADGGGLVHYESAREIAAWYAMGANAFTRFATTGGISGGLTDDIEREQLAIAEWPTETEQQRTERSEQILTLGALRAYIRASLPEDES